MCYIGNTIPQSHVWIAINKYHIPIPTFLKLSFLEIVKPLRYSTSLAVFPQTNGQSARVSEETLKCLNRYFFLH